MLTEPSSASPEEQANPQKPYSQLEALAYPARGLCLMVFVGTVMFLMISIGLTGEDGLRAGMPGGLSIFLNLVMLWFLLPIFLGIIRSTAFGDNTLDELPSLFDFEARFQDLVAFLLAGMMPAALSGLISFGVTLAVGTAPTGPEAGMVIAAAMVAGLFLFGMGIMAIGAAAVYGENKLALRLDLHFTALRAAWKAVLMIVLRSVLLITPGVVFVIALIASAFTPNLGSMSGILVALAPILFIACYVVLDGWHFVGLIFRQQERQLAQIYLRS